MQIDLKKQKRQREGIKRWRFADEHGSHAKGFGTLWWVTGMGKTFAALNECTKPFLTKHPAKTVLVLVHREKLEKQWIHRVTKFLEACYFSQITVRTVQYYIKNKIVPSCDLLIVDEVHKFYEDVFFSYVNGTNIKRKFLLCLTATYLDPQGRHLKLEKIAPVVDHIPEPEALENGWISKYVEYNLKVELTNDERIRYKELCEFLDKNLSKFPKQNGFGAAQKCIQGGISSKDGKPYTGFHFAKAWATHNGYKWVQKGMEYTLTPEQQEVNAKWNPFVIIGYAKNVMNGIRARKDFLYTCKSKVDTVVNVINKFEEYKIMSFSESTEFADTIFKILNKQKEESCVVYHSQLSSRRLKDEHGNWYLYKSGKKKGQEKIFGITTLKRIYTQAFVNNDVRVLSTARALDEGFDCEDIRIGVISSRSMNFNQQTQRKGRPLRVIPEKPNAIMLIINVYIEMSRDYDVLMHAQKKSTNKIHWVDNIDDIVFEPKAHESFDDI